jgi:hypothetical protein
LNYLYLNSYSIIAGEKSDKLLCLAKVGIIIASFSGLGKQENATEISSWYIELVT